MRKLYGVQYLRALAAIGVVVFHAAERSGGHFVIGAAGVDVFFVISGFIMWVISQQRPVSPSRFLGDRIKRIVPAYWLATAAMVLGGVIGAFPNLTLTAGHVIGSFLFIPHRSPNGGEIWPVLVQGWTLNYEMFFYAIFALVLTAPQAARIGLLTAIFLLLAAVGVAFRFENPVLLTYTSPALLEFVIGLFIARFWLAGTMPSARVGGVLVAVAIAGFAFVGTTYIGFNPFVLGPFAALLLVGTLAVEKGGWMPRWQWATLLGDGSYAIYLWHTFAISVAAKLAGVLHVPAILAVLASTAAGIALGLVMYISGRFTVGRLKQRPLRAATSSGGPI